MRKLDSLSRMVAAPLAAALLITSFDVGVARAGLVATDNAAREMRAGADRERVTSFVQREDVRREMQSLGIAPAEADARIAAMSDEEIAQIAQRLDQLPAGEGAVGAIVGAALIVFIVLLITDVAGVTDVFSFTK